MEIALECISKHVTYENLWLSKVELVLERETTKILLCLAQKKRNFCFFNFWKLWKMDQNLT